MSGVSAGPAGPHPVASDTIQPKHNQRLQNRTEQAMDMNRNPTGKGGFQKGVSGNPAGRPKEIREVKALAREHTAEALDTLAQIMRDHKAPQAARVSAARELLDRGYGRAESSVNGKIETPEKKPDFSVLSPDELERWHQGHAILAPLIDKVLHNETASSDESVT